MPMVAQVTSGFSTEIHLLMSVMSSSIESKTVVEIAVHHLAVHCDPRRERKIGG